MITVGADRRPLEVQPLLLKVDEVCERTRLGRTAVYGLISSGALRSVKIGSARRISVADLNEFVLRLRTVGLERATSAS